MKVVLVGRPNVGKSALFNRIVGRRLSIVDDEEGTTRDQLSASVDFFGKQFCLVDSAGFDPSSKTLFAEELASATLRAIDEADSAIMVVDGRVGVSQLDKKVAKILLKSQKRIILAINKIDNLEEESSLFEFDSLGIKEKIAVSAVHGHNIEDLLSLLLQDQPLAKEVLEIEEKTTKRVAIVGQPNAGKSTLLNAILQKDRVLISPIAGTTRDIVEESFSFDGHHFTFIDTAGLRRKSSHNSNVEKFSYLRAKEGIKKADICLLLVDATMQMSLHDKKIAEIIEREGKSAILVFTKWDLVKSVPQEKFKSEIMIKIPNCYYPMLFISAKNGRNIDQLLQELIALKERQKVDISTSELNKFIERCMNKYHPPAISGKRFKIFYLTQTHQNPPKFLLFVNDKTLFVNSYKQYLINEFRKSFDIEGIPIDFMLRVRPKKKLK